eukprot:882692-Ditylum_brightwellii.AAC.1
MERSFVRFQNRIRGKRMMLWPILHRVMSTLPRSQLIKWCICISAPYPGGDYGAPTVAAIKSSWHSLFFLTLPLLLILLQHNCRFG